jgi:hypothetical protein
MHDLAHARAFLEPIAATRRSRGWLVTDQHLQRAAALLVDLWAAASAHGIPPDQPGHHTHLPRAAFDTIAAAIRAEHGWTIHTKPKVAGRRT